MSNLTREIFGMFEKKIRETETRNNQLVRVTGNRNDITSEPVKELVKKVESTSFEESFPRYVGELNKTSINTNNTEVINGIFKGVILETDS